MQNVTNKGKKKLAEGFAQMQAQVFHFLSVLICICLNDLLVTEQFHLVIKNIVYKPLQILQRRWHYLHLDQLPGLSCQQCCPAVHQKYLHQPSSVIPVAYNITITDTGTEVFLVLSSCVYCQNNPTQDFH